jgi:hypothetical protein
MANMTETRRTTPTGYWNSQNYWVCAIHETISDSPGHCVGCLQDLIGELRDVIDTSKNVFTGHYFGPHGLLAAKVDLMREAYRKEVNDEGQP